jgi:hypothetical protein
MASMSARYRCLKKAWINGKLCMAGIIPTPNCTAAGVTIAEIQSIRMRQVVVFKILGLVEANECL